MVDFERLSAKPGEAGLPLCAGAMDGTLMILKPSLWGDSYYCYKSFIAIVILAVVDARCIFTYIDAGRAGSMGDTCTYNHSFIETPNQQWTVAASSLLDH